MSGDNIGPIQRMSGIAPDAAVDLPLPQRLALSYAPKRSRAVLLGVLALDARLATIVRRRQEMVLTQMRIAWWRDLLAKDVVEWPAGDAVTDLLRQWRDPARLAPLADGWEMLLSEFLDPRAIEEFAQGRAGAFTAAADELGLPRDDGIEPAARRWALADLAANVTDADERRQIVSAADMQSGPFPLPRALRPLTVLAGLGDGALRKGGAPLLDGPGDMLRALRLGIVGR